MVAKRTKRSDDESTGAATAPTKPRTPAVRKKAAVADAAAPSPVVPRGPTVRSVQSRGQSRDAVGATGKVAASIAGQRTPATASGTGAATNAPLHVTTVAQLLDIAQQRFGLREFRPGQAEAFTHLLAGHDVLAVMPTGSGKSLLYQLTSVTLPGITVVVSPLIALIKDQLDKMVTRGIAALRIDSTLTPKQRREVDELVKQPGGKLLLTTPERMADPEFRVFLREASGRVGVSRLVVDEAHCVSQWGHDFRPAYLSLRKAIEDLGRPPILATTATAPPHVRQDILHQLGIADAQIVTTTFDRPNLHYEVIVFGDDNDKFKTLTTLLRKLPRPSIVYCATVKKVEELADALGRYGLPVARYHGRLTKNERETEQQRYMESRDLVMIATNAFGLGVDKANVRNVFHYHVPGSLEAYAQEAGRGGRDRKPARCVLLFSPDDVAIQEYFLSGSYPTRRQVRSVYDALEAFAQQKGRPDAAPSNITNVALSSHVGTQRTRTVLSLLKDEGFVVELSEDVFEIASPPKPMTLLMEKAKQYEARRVADRQRLGALLDYVKADSCRNQVILTYLGETDPPPCGRCDNCMRARGTVTTGGKRADIIGTTFKEWAEVEGDLDESKIAKAVRHRVVRIDGPPAPGETTDITAKAGPVASAQNDASPSTLTPPSLRPAPVPSPMNDAANGEDNEEDDDIDDDELTDDDKDIEGANDAGNVDDEEDDGDDDDLDDDEDDDDEDLDDDEDDDDDDEDADDDLDDDEDDDDDDEDADDDLDDDEDDDDDDYEIIERTAAELADEGVHSDSVLTILARKRQPKQPRQKRPRLGQVTREELEAARLEARRRRRRRRRKRRAMLPRRAQFTTPVISTALPPSSESGGRSGPLVEYVRTPIRLAMSPAAAANPHEPGRRRPGGGRNFGGGPPTGGDGKRRRRRRRRPGVEPRPGGNPHMGAMPPRPSGAPAGDDPMRRRRRRRRGGRGRGGGGGSGASGGGFGGGSSSGGGFGNPP